MFPPVPHDRGSPRSRELAERISRLVEEYRAEHRIGDDEVRQAFREAGARTSVSRTGGRSAVILGLVVALAGGLAVFAEVSGEAAGLPVDPTMPAGIIILLVAAVFLVVRTLRSR